MFQSNSRIENFNGIRFYEKDILYDDYIYTNDIQIVIDLEYLSPGIGIALMNNEGLSLKDQKEVFLFKVGYKDATVTYKLNNIIKKVYSMATSFYPPHEFTKMVFTKTGRRITLSIEGLGNLIEYILPNPMDKYSLGIYSNAGNILKDISIASSIPDYWNVNMRNTNGGHLRFIKNGFTLENCMNEAEIEQPEITLEAGYYYLKYDSTDSDIKCYMVKSGDNRLYDEEKNILGLNNSFKLDETDTVNIKFKGKSGTIKNILITDKLNDKYVATRGPQTTIEGSYMSIKTDKLSTVKWTGTIYDIPLTDPENINSTAVLIHGSESLPWSVAGTLFNQEYIYIYDTKKALITIYKDKDVVFSKTFSSTVNMITVFKNMDAVITQITLSYENGQEVDLITEKTTKKYIPTSIASPIIVIDDDNIPLDLSASYRVYNENGNDKYVFTNWEREIFDSNNKLQLTNKVSLDPGTVKVYGIPIDAKVVDDNIFRIPKADMDTITMFTDKYVDIKEKDLFYINKASGEIRINDFEEYKLIVIDYLKVNSYSINTIGDSSMYEVDISSNSQNTYLIYDNKSETVGNKTLMQTNEYKTTEIIPQNKSYIVLRREGF